MHVKAPLILASYLAASTSVSKLNISNASDNNITTALINRFRSHPCGNRYDGPASDWDWKPVCDLDSR